MKNKFLALAAIVLLAAACSKSDELSVPSNFPADGVIRVATSVDEPTATRAGMTTDNIENFNLKIVNSVNPKYNYYAFCYGNGSVGWLYYKEDAKTLQTLLWQNSSQPITVTALCREGSHISEYYFNSDEGSCIVQPDQSDEYSLNYSDVLYMEPTEINPATDLVDGKLPIKFKHLCSKVNLAIKLGTEFNVAPGTGTNPITDLKVNGTLIRAGWNASTNSAFDFTVTEQSPVSITPCEGSYMAGNGSTGNARAKYECILLPQKVAADNFTVTFKIGDKEYEWKSTAEVNLESGKRYTLDLTVGKDLVTLGGFTASAWTEGTGGNTETE